MKNLFGKISDFFPRHNLPVFRFLEHALVWIVITAINLSAKYLQKTQKKKINKFEPKKILKTFELTTHAIIDSQQFLAKGSILDAMFDGLLVHTLLRLSFARSADVVSRHLSFTRIR